MIHGNEINNWKNRAGGRHTQTPPLADEGLVQQFRHAACSEPERKRGGGWTTSRVTYQMSGVPELNTH